MTSWFKKKYRDSYESGWSVGWQEIGELDARNGVCRAGLFRVHWYNMGWWNQMLELKSKGWINNHLERMFLSMEQDYWKKIGSGHSNEFYEHISNN